MEKDKKKKGNQGSISEIYASLLGKGRLVGLIILLITFTLYMTSLITPYIKAEEIEKFWSLNTEEYLEQTGIPTGWGWITMLPHSDFMNFIGIGILAGITLLCYLRIIPLFYKRKEYFYVIIAIIEVIVLITAASGLIKIH